MKRVFIFSALLALAALAASCAKEPVEQTSSESIDTNSGELFYINAASPSTKTSIDGNDGVSILWTNGDKIKVNNHNSIGLAAEDNNGTSARFAFTPAEQPEAPYYAVYNATRAYGYGEVGGEHTYKLSLDYNNYTQAWVEDSFDKEFAVMYGVGNNADEGIAFHHAMAYLKVTPTTGTEDVAISKVMVFSRGGEALSGRFIIDAATGAMTTYRDNKDYVTMAAQSGVEIGKSFMVAIPAGTYSSGLKIRIVDVNGNMVEKSSKALTAVAGTVYPVNIAYSNPVACPPVATAAEVSSSTANFTWDGDNSLAYTIQCSASSDFTGATEYTIPAGSSSSVWKGKSPKFCFGGLNQGTTYYFRVKSGEGAWSNTAIATTSTFNLTVVDADAQAGDVILAEDFHDSCEGGENVAQAAGYGTKQAAFKTYTDAGATMNNASTWTPWASASFGNWGWTRPSGGATFYPNQGHIKLGRAGDNSLMVTPELSAINGYADIEVEVTAAVYPDATDRAKTQEFFVATVKGTFDANHTIAISSLDLPGKAVIPMTDNTKWVTYKATLCGVAGDDHLVIGSNYDAGNARLLVSDVKVTVKSVSNFAATATEVSSSTVSFTWGYAGATAEENIAHPYSIALYRDAACTDLVVSHNISASNACWKSRKPKFCFGGLEPATTYYFKVTDSGASVESSVISATTTAFTNITMPATPAAAGDVILAEDFSEIIYGGEAVIGAAAAATGETNDDIFAKVTGEDPTCVLKQDSNEKSIIVSQLASTRLANWRYDQVGGNANIYGHVGNIKLGTGSYKSYAITPELSAIPEGKTASLEVTVTLSCYSGATAKAIVAAVTGTDGGARFTVDDLTANKCTDITTVVGAWKTYTITLDNVTRDQRLAIGPATGNTNNKSRMMVSDVKVKIKSLN